MNLKLPEIAPSLIIVSSFLFVSCSLIQPEPPAVSTTDNESVLSAEEIQEVDQSVEENLNVDLEAENEKLDNELKSFYQ